MRLLPKQAKPKRAAWCYVPALSMWRWGGVGVLTGLPPPQRMFPLGELLEGQPRGWGRCLSLSYQPGWVVLSFPVFEVSLLPSSPERLEGRALDQGLAEVWKELEAPLIWCWGSIYSLLGSPTSFFSVSIPGQGCVGGSWLRAIPASVFPVTCPPQDTPCLITTIIIMPFHSFTPPTQMYGVSEQKKPEAEKVHAE